MKCSQKKKKNDVYITDIFIKNVHLVYFGSFSPVVWIA